MLSFFGQRRALSESACQTKGVVGNGNMYRHRTYRGYSLLEVVLASTICATALVPALAYLRDGVTLADTIDKRHLILIYGVSKMEEQMSIVAATWAEGTSGGDFATDGHANIRYTVTRSDDPSSGGLADRLMYVSVTAYSDDDGDDALDTSELRTILTTKISKLATYESKANS
jgi:hypothetical protein